MASEFKIGELKGKQYTSTVLHLLGFGGIDNYHTQALKLIIV